MRHINLCRICTSSTIKRLENVRLKHKETYLLRDSIICMSLSNELFVHTCRSNYINIMIVKAAKIMAQTWNTGKLSPVKRKLRKSSSSSEIEVGNLSDTFDWKKIVWYVEVKCRKRENALQQKKENISHCTV